MRKFSLKHQLSRLRVGQKIGLGYSVALGIAVSGTVAGFAIGNSYYKEASEREIHARNEVELLHRLQTSILQARTHQQQLIPLAQAPEDFQEEYEHLLKHENQIYQTWAEFQAFNDKESHSLNSLHHELIPSFLQTYKGVLELYFQELKQLIKTLDLYNLDSPKEIEQTQKTLLAFTNSDLAIKFDGISDDLVEIIEHSYKEMEEAEQLFQQSSVIAQNIAIASIILSIAISIFLVIFTSRAIAQPIQVLTGVARRSTEESNFDLQVSIESQDEIGILANSFNQLISAVKDLLDQQRKANKNLELYNQTLEEKVQVRTQELSERNLRLEQLLEELQRTQTQLVQAEKMSSLGQLVAGVAHEINNPVNFIHGNLNHVQEYAFDLLEFLELYQQHYPHPVSEIEAKAEEIDLEFLQEDLPKTLASMQMGTERIRKIVLSLRNFSRMDEADFKAVDIHEGIESTLLILQHRLKARPERPGIEVIRQYGNLPPVECYPGQLNQVLMNILVNAIDAFDEINAERSYQEIQENSSRITISTAVTNSQYIQIAIADNATGIPEMIKKQIFQPFFTTKPAGKGTGMGMAISHQIITEKHEGQLECFSTPGQGTEFVITIPVQQVMRQVS